MLILIIIAVMESPDSMTWDTDSCSQMCRTLQMHLKDSRQTSCKNAVCMLRWVIEAWICSKLQAIVVFGINPAEMHFTHHGFASRKCISFSKSCSFQHRGTWTTYLKMFFCDQEQLSDSRTHCASVHRRNTNQLLQCLDSALHELSMVLVGPNERLREQHGVMPWT